MIGMYNYILTVYNFTRRKPGKPWRRIMAQDASAQFSESFDKHTDSRVELEFGLNEGDLF